jgi:hypothetical protein
MDGWNYSSNDTILYSAVEQRSARNHRVNMQKQWPSSSSILKSAARRWASLVFMQWMRQPYGLTVQTTDASKPKEQKTLVLIF